MFNNTTPPDLIYNIVHVTLCPAIEMDIGCLEDYFPFNSGGRWWGKNISRSCCTQTYPGCPRTFFATRFCQDVPCWIIQQAYRTVTVLSPVCVCVFVYDRKNQMPRNTENPGRHIKDWETCNVCVQVNIGHLEDGQNGWAKWGPSGVQVWWT